MEKTTVTLGDFEFIATYEFIPAEEADYEYPGTQPIIRLWHLETLKNENVTDTLTKDEWFDVEEQIYAKKLD